VIVTSFDSAGSPLGSGLFQLTPNLARSTTASAPSCDARPIAAADPIVRRGPRSCAADPIVPLGELLRLGLELGREQVAHGEASIRSPALCQLDHLVIGWDVVETVRPLDRAA
jgi:hypothetical protein